MSNLFTRSIAGIVFSAVVITSAVFGPLAVGLLFLFFSVVGLYEVYELEKHKDSNAPRWFRGMSIGVLIYLLVFLISTDTIPAEWMWLLAVLIPLMFCAELFKLDSHTLSNLSITIFGWLYVVLPFSMLNVLPLVAGIYDYLIPVGYFLVLWANDTGAYFTGKFLGRHKLYERVSPNKTWEGLAGGVALSFIAAYALSTYTNALPLRDWMVMAFIVSIFGNVGDLFESHLKRNFGVKDSGTIIPGHGGVLDRFDGLLISLPVLIGYFKLIQFL